MNLEASDRGITLVFGQNLNFNSLEESVKIYHRALGLKQHLLLQAKEVILVDAAGLQALLIFLNTLKNEGASFEWQQASSNLKQVAELLGMKQLLAL